MLQFFKKESDNMVINLPAYIKEILNILNQKGEAFVVGGCVRDYLLGLTPHDWDITTDRLPEEVKEIFKDYKIINNNGEKHGTVTIIYKNKQVEITTYRIDKDYLDGRHPSTVSFSRSLSNDLARRDFTINALAYNEEKGLVDLYGGLNDLKNGLIKTVRTAEQRFLEDYLRILRGVRFVSKLGFKMETKTYEASVKLAPNILKYISGERVREELKGLLLGKNVLNTLLNYQEIIFAVIPELRPCYKFKQNNPHHKHDVYTHICYVTSYTKPYFTLRLSALLHDIAKPMCYTEEIKGSGVIGHFYGHAEKGVNIVSNICDRLKLSNIEKEEVLYLVKEHDSVILPNKKVLKRLLIRTPSNNIDLIYKLLDLKKADNKDHLMINELNEKEIIKVLDSIIKEKDAIKVTDLAIKGKDLIELGFKGKDIGLMLNKLLDLVIEEKLNNNKEELITYVKKTLV